MSDLTIRLATPDDLETLIALYADDQYGASRDGLTAETEPVYRAALERVAAEPSTAIHVAEKDGRLVGTFQLTITPGLAQKGMVRATIEAVRIDGALRGQGLGRAMMALAIKAARARGATMMQLTSNAGRRDAHRFYEALGFAKSHTGFKLKLDMPAD
jgi:GNAT superfamily N-acetyltransferase